MYCKNCGKKLQDGFNSCNQCGFPVEQPVHPPLYNSGIEQESMSAGRIESQRNLMEKLKKSISIIWIIAGGLLVLFIVDRVEYDWGFMQFIAGVTTLVRGIQLRIRVKDSPIAITTIVGGVLLIIISFLSEVDWGLIGFVGGILLLVVGILEILHKSPMAQGIVQIVFGALLVWFGMVDIDYAWGEMGLFMGIASLVSGILMTVYSDKINRLRG